MVRSRGLAITDYQSAFANLSLHNRVTSNLILEVVLVMDGRIKTRRFAHHCACHEVVI